MGGFKGNLHFNIPGFKYIESFSAFFANSDVGTRIF